MLIVDLGFGPQVFYLVRFIEGGAICSYPSTAKAVHGVPYPYFNRVKLLDMDILSIHCPD